MRSKLLDGAMELRRLYGCFWSSRVLLTANNFRVFEHLKSPRTAEGVARLIRADRRATGMLLDALTGLGLLKKSASRCANTALSGRFLVSDSPYYQGDILRHADVLWQNWSGLDGVIRSGRPHHSAHDQVSFIRGMHNLAVLKAKDVVKAFGVKGVRRALDLGGGPGTYSLEMSRKGVMVTLFDRPETIQIAKDIIGKSGARNVSFIQGDFLYDDIGKDYDLIFISQVLHSCSEDESRGVIERSARALNPGGRIVVQEFYIHKSMTQPVHSALFSINMLINTPEGRCYSPSEIRAWLSASGFRNIRDKRMEDTVLIIGEKSS